MHFSLALPAVVRGAEGRAGEQIYRLRCASCHGPSGEGNEENYPHPLVGEKPLDKLTAYIARTMPKNAKKKCTPEEAQAVAGYILEAFYSPQAQARNKPVRAELARLTVRQYRNAVADLVGTFRPGASISERCGLHGEYFKTRSFRKEERLIERIDPEVHFDFGAAAPGPDRFDVHQFSARWEGSILATETGEHEFIVRTEHAARLWVNDQRHPLIDAWVKSGNDTEYRGSIFLTSGRAYPLRLEFSKAKQGVDDSKNGKNKPAVKASIVLEWKPPRLAAQVIPQRSLAPERGAPVFVVTTPFPPDDRSAGYERGTSISRAWEQAVTDAAIETSGHVLANLRDLAGVRDDAPDRKDRLRDFCLRFAERAFRRPLSAEQKRRYVERQFESAATPDLAVKRVVLLVLQSPRFLYREIDGGSDSYDVAARLSFGLWGSLPDTQLLKAAADGRLKTPEQVRKEAERMLGDQRARGNLRDFFLQWLKVDPPPDLSKDTAKFPGFDRAVASDLRTSLELTLEDVVWGKTSDYRQLFLDKSLYLNGRLAKLYGADLPVDAPLQKVAPSGPEPAGILTHPYLLAAFAYTGSSSPIHRGVFVARNVLGRVLRPPPEAFTPLAADLHPDLTTRQRVALQTRPQSCQGCHGMINDLGFTLEHFDAIGRYREREKARPIDASGSYQTRSGKVVKFEGARDLATFLATSEEAQEAFIERLFHHLVKQPVRAFGSSRLADLRRAFTQNQYSVRKLVVEIMTVAALPDVERNSFRSAKGTE